MRENDQTRKFAAPLPKLFTVLCDRYSSTNLGISTNLRTPEEERNYSEPMNSNISIANVKRDALLKERDKIRQESLIALRNGDVRKVAQLTTQTAQINQILNQLEF
jgi:hypothetical protein